jgi:hypothetical protein
LLTDVPNPRLIQSENWTLFEATIKAKSSRNDDISAMVRWLHYPNSASTDEINRLRRSSTFPTHVSSA